MLSGYSQSKAYSDNKTTVDLNFNMLNSMAEKHSFILSPKEDFEIEAFLITDKVKLEKAKQSAFETAHCEKCKLVGSKKTESPMDDVFEMMKEGEVYIVKFQADTFVLERYANFASY